MDRLAKVKADSHTTLTPKPVGEIAGSFFVPAYQRGYRWGEVEVRRLLDDIAAAGSNAYYLQPIVVKAREDGSWELVDGQQRLTTLYLLLRYISTHLPTAQLKYTLHYETRPGSAAYLDAPVEEDSQANIDYFHIHQAYRAIRDWFEHPDSRGGQLAASPGTGPNCLLDSINMFKALSESVHIIWYEAEPHVESADLFARLNVGRIPLTDAELVKALVLSSIRNVNPDRAPEIAAQWDSIERELRSPEVWAFVSGKSEMEASHLGLLLDVMAGHVDRREAPLYETFEKLRPRIEEDPQGFWNDVVDLHSHIIGWYEDRRLYHWIGFLVSEGVTIQQVWRMHDGASKQQFRDRLVNRIRRRLNLSEEELRDLTYHSGQTPAVLLLMNVETILRNEDSHERYSFHGHARTQWSLEHIHAQNAERLNTDAQWREWLRLHLEALADVPGVGDDAVEALRAQMPAEGKEITRRRFDELQRRVIQCFNDAGLEIAGDEHAIDNLALLAAGDNSALSNSVFEVKRRDIIDRDRTGAFIPPCTRNVFLKYYTEARGQQLHFWGPEDRRGYLDAMVSMLRPYLKSDDTSEGEGTNDD